MEINDDWFDRALNAPTYPGYQEASTISSNNITMNGEQSNQTINSNNNNNESNHQACTLDKPYVRLFERAKNEARKSKVFAIAKAAKEVKKIITPMSKPLQYLLDEETTHDETIKELFYLCEKIKEMNEKNELDLND